MSEQTQNAQTQEQMGPNATVGASDHHQHGGAGKNTGMAVLAYIGVLVLIPHFTVKNDPFVRFHVRQGFVLLGIEIAVWLLSMAVWPLWMLWNLISLGAIILSIIGIVQVLNGKQTELPLVGSLAKHIKF